MANFWDFIGQNKQFRLTYYETDVYKPDWLILRDKYSFCDCYFSIRKQYRNDELGYYHSVWGVRLHPFWNCDFLPANGVSYGDWDGTNLTPGRDWPQYIAYVRGGISDNYAPSPHTYYLHGKFFTGDPGVTNYGTIIVPQKVWNDIPFPYPFQRSPFIEITVTARYVSPDSDDIDIEWDVLLRPEPPDPDRSYERRDARTLEWYRR